MKPEKGRLDQTPGAVDVHHNRLIHEKSPYLLQHADNPVDWYPWGEEAFARASREGKPVFLSIGYTTCHWCHVMAHESFEDTHVAGLLNENFISIKVDREERPDIDSIYMSVCQMMTGQGGWPLTLILTPEKKPIFAGTYIPKESRFGMPGLIDLLSRITKSWKERRRELITSAEEIAAALVQGLETGHAHNPDLSMLNQGYQELALRFDATNGGFGNAPKFPTPHNILFLLRFWKRTADKHALAMVEKTLGAMRLGGIYDHVGGGFHRYSTDARWKVPHFEKMLYDQALLVMAYTEAYQVTRNPKFRKTAEEIISYVFRDLTSPEGAFFSAEDADSEGREGAFYLWTASEIEEVLGKEDAIVAAHAFNVTHTGNYHDKKNGRGLNILYRTQSIARLASPFNFADIDLASRLESIMARLCSARKRRPRPSLDDKILTDWNGLFIAALAQAARTFGNENYLEAARRAMQFVLSRMRDTNGGLMHRYRDGESAIPAFGDDYAFIIKALIELYESTFEPSYLASARELNTIFLAHFWDEAQGGFFTISDSTEILLIRKKEIYDGAIPSCNSVAFENLVRLAHLTGDAAIEQKASVLSAGFCAIVQRSPSAHTWFLCALDSAIGPIHDVVIVGKRDGSDTQAMIDALEHHYLPHVLVLYRPIGESDYLLTSLAPFTRTLCSISEKATAYFCTGHTCAIPTTEVNKMLELLGCLD
ncbi:MAG: thioredoxin domain-containing protein [Candidatus Atribacteria bacterium]|nr:MAG: thioredoxin domain-containing protein [Candidatus Atribacteria bacterium]